MNQEALKLFGKSLIYSFLLAIVFIVLNIIFLFPLLFNLSIYTIGFSFAISFIIFPFIINKFAHSIVFGWKSKMPPYIGSCINMIKAQCSFNAHLLFIIFVLSIYYFTKNGLNSERIDNSEVEKKSEIIKSIYRILKDILPNEIANLSFILYGTLSVFFILLFFTAVFKPILDLKFTEKLCYRFDLYFLYIMNNNKHSFKDIVEKYKNCKWTSSKFTYSFYSMIFCMLLYILLSKFIQEPVSQFFFSLTITIWMNLYLFIITWKEYEEVENYKPIKKVKKKKFSFNFSLSKN